MKQMLSSMKKVSVSLDDRHIDLLEQRQEEGVDSRSEALRGVLDEYEELRAECEDLRTECERLRNEKQTLLKQREEHGELVKYVREERTAEQRRREASLLERARWWAFGMPSEEA